ncbi:uncharacterized protein LOC125674977 [Ostrea edulis]|uniref:uncharacterized protein LOC125674977 n=1 Tax=Ostrea edulis TaxID=37623 RepID=UPI0024AF18F8|nr:uncharacterized protein LOC125674977 [Ostrea edulis]
MSSRLENINQSCVLPTELSDHRRSKSSDRRRYIPVRCCRGYKWDAQTESCVGCQYPYYGLLCQYVCDCTEPNCKRFDGCRTTPISTEAGTYTRVDTGIASLSTEPALTTGSHTSVTHDNTTEGQDSTRQGSLASTTRQGSLASTARQGSLGSTTIQGSFGSTTRQGSKGSRFFTNRALIITLVFLSILVILLILAYVSIRVSDAVNTRLRGRISEQEAATPNQYEEIELNGMTQLS